MTKKTKSPTSKWSLTTWLQKYYKIQTKILLVHRPTSTSYWGDRCLYLDDKYSPTKKYNHRSILANEVVIEHDNDDLAQNKTISDEIMRRMRRDGIKLSKWHSGNRSYHIHCLVNLGNCKNIPLLKKCFMEHYSEGLGKPDTRLAVENHLIRAEHGIHEKTGNCKSLHFKDAEYPCVSDVPKPVWERYYAEQRTIVARRLTRDVSALVDHPGLQYILTAHQFREANDGHERALFMLIHVLKPKYIDDKQGLVKYLQEWYRYSGGTKITDNEIANKVSYHWKREYTFSEKYLRELLESIGRADLMDLKK